MTPLAALQRNQTKRAQVKKQMSQEAVAFNQTRDRAGVGRGGLGQI